MEQRENLSTARWIVGTIPLVMRVVSHELRRAAPLQDFSQVGLMRLLAHKGACQVSVLADLWSVSTPTMSRSIRRLEERGWVRLARTAEDRRQVFVELTDAGHKVLAESYDRMTERVEGLVRELSPEDHASLRAGLDVLYKMFDGAFKPPTTPDEARALVRDRKTSDLMYSENEGDQSETL